MLGGICSIFAGCHNAVEKYRGYVIDTETGTGVVGSSIYLQEIIGEQDDLRVPDTCSGVRRFGSNPDLVDTLAFWDDAEYQYIVFHDTTTSSANGYFEFSAAPSTDHPRSSGHPRIISAFFRLRVIADGFVERYFGISYLCGDDQKDIILELERDSNQN